MPFEETDDRRGQEARLTAWIASPDARSAARSVLQSLGAGREGHVEDLLADTWMKVQKRLTASPLVERSEGSDPVVAYARATMHHVAVDLFRTPRETSLEELLAEGWEPSPRPEDLLEETDLDGSWGAVDAADLEDEVVRSTRLGLHARLPDRHVDAWVVSAALTTVSLRGDTVEVAADIPVPERESPGWARRHLWAGLAYARQDRCFEQPDRGAVRERR
ncbi:MAG: sigma-70 family RNA polymerase sigma factor, partial [Acidimicrobiales bacterium]|nr:sigma-70 family RNA polymerase sigma factor [Acidimicrobiales bacterium]